MEIILKQDVPNLGHAGKVVKVKNGYGNNYLIPQGLAVLATSSALKVNAENIRQRSFKEDRIKNNAHEAAEALKNKEFRIGAKTSTTGKIFGSVNTIQIAEALAKKGFEIDRKMISIVDEDSIKEIGTYRANIKLHREVSVEISFEVFAE